MQPSPAGCLAGQTPRIQSQRPMNSPLPFHPRTKSTSRGNRKNITIPGILHEVLLPRTREFGHRSISPFAIDLVCYDLRSNAPHTITLAIDRDSQSAQDAVDAELAAQYRPGQARNGLLVQIVEHLDRLRSVTRFAKSAPPLRKKSERITFPAKIWPFIDLRWRTLGYASLSAYVTGLIRYDLLVGGPHIFDGGDTRPEILSALDQETLAVHQRGTRRKLFLDYLIERTQSKALTGYELDRAKVDIANKLLGHVTAQRSGELYTCRRSR